MSTTDKITAAVTALIVELPHRTASFAEIAKRAGVAESTARRHADLVRRLTTTENHRRLAMGARIGSVIKRLAADCTFAHEATSTASDIDEIIGTEPPLVYNRAEIERGIAVGVARLLD